LHQVAKDPIHLDGGYGTRLVVLGDVGGRARLADLFKAANIGGRRRAIDLLNPFPRAIIGIAFGLGRCRCFVLPGE